MYGICFWFVDDSFAASPYFRNENSNNDCRVSVPYSVLIS